MGKQQRITNMDFNKWVEVLKGFWFVNHNLTYIQFCECIKGYKEKEFADYMEEIK